MNNNTFKLEFKLDNQLSFDIISNSNLCNGEFEFDFKEYNLGVPISKFFEIQKKYLYSLIDKKIIKKIIFKNFPESIIYSFFLKSHMCLKYWKFVDILNCDFECLNYKKKFGETEFLGEDYFEFNSSKEISKIENFKSCKVKDMSFELLELIKNNDFLVKSSFIFVDSYLGKSQESNNDRFVCYLYKMKNSKVFDNYLQSIFGSKKFLEIEKCLQLSSKVGISFAEMKDKSIRKTLYFSCDEYSENELKVCLDILNIKPELSDKIWGIGIDFDEENNFKIKVYHQKEKIKIYEIDDFVSDIPDEFKSKYNKIINYSFSESLRGVLLDFKIKNNKIIAKRIDISLELNKFENDKIFSELEIKLDKYDDKELVTLSFEFYYTLNQKVNLYYKFKK